MAWHAVHLELKNTMPAALPGRGAGTMRTERMARTESSASFAQKPPAEGVLYGGALQLCTSVSVRAFYKGVLHRGALQLWRFVSGRPHINCPHLKAPLYKITSLKGALISNALI